MKISPWFRHEENGNTLFLRQLNHTLEFKFEKRNQRSRFSFEMLEKAAKIKGLGDVVVDVSALSKKHKIGVAKTLFEVDKHRKVRLYKNIFHMWYRMAKRLPLVEFQKERVRVWFDDRPALALHPTFVAKFMQGTVFIYIKTPKNLKLPHAYICSDCAFDRGGRWPEGHCATSHTDICPYCNKQEGLVATTDYLWHKQKRLLVWD